MELNCLFCFICFLLSVISYEELYLKYLRFLSRYVSVEACLDTACGYSASGYVSARRVAKRIETIGLGLILHKNSFSKHLMLFG